MTTSPAPPNRVGRPPLSRLEKQRRLVGRLNEASAALELKITELARLSDLIRIEPTLLIARLQTLHERLGLARKAAQAEHSGDKEEATRLQSVLNMARPLGITLSDWDLLDHAKFNAPGKPKLAIEIEYARLEISRIFEERTLFDLETEGSETHGASSPKTDSKPHNPIGRPSTGPLGKLDRQLHTALYRKRDLSWNNRSRLSDNGTRGRPPLPIETRMARLDDVIATCRTLIKEAESALGVQDLQRRLIKRLKDAASRVRMSMRTMTGSALVLQKSLLENLEAEITIESETLEQLRGRAFQGGISLTDLRAAIVEKTVAFDTNLYARTISPRAAAIF